MTKRALRSGALILVIAVALAPAPSQALAPLLLLMVRQIAQQAATSMIKDTLLSGLSGMGCKGMALSNALTALDLRGVPGGMAGNLLGGMPTLPAGMTVRNLPSAVTMPTLPGGAGMAMGGIPADMAAKLGAMLPTAGQLPPGMAMNPEQLAMLANVQQSINQPLSAPETLATIDELSELGFLPKPMQAELKECMVLVPAAVPALGMAMGILKPIIPQLQQVRGELQALSPAEQDEVADTLVQEMQPLPAEQRAALIETLDGGFFPRRVSEGVKTRLAAHD